MRRRHVTAISVVGAIALLLTYGVWLFDYLRWDLPREAGRGAAFSLTRVRATGRRRRGLGVRLRLVRLGAFPAMEKIGVSKAFAGLVVVGIAGNAVENTTGIVLALKGEADFAISVVKNSVAQITAFLFPALVLVSLLFTTQLTFALGPIYIGALLLTAIALWQITSDGEGRGSRASPWSPST